MRVEWRTSEGEHIAYMVFKEVVPEPGEEPFLWPEFTEVKPAAGRNESEVVEWLTELLENTIVVDNEGEPLLWEDDDYLEFMIREFRPGAVTALLVG